MEIVVPDEFKYLYVQTAERPVVKVPAAVLRQTAKPVTKLATKQVKLIDEMIRIMKLANGIGLAAPQVGVLDRIVIVAAGGMKPLPLINPEIVAQEGSQIGEEGGLSIPGL